MKIWEDDLVTDDLQRIVESDTEILSTESEDIPVHIMTTNGELDADFDSFTLALDDGRPITFQELCVACERYWTRWSEEAKAKRGQIEPDGPANWSQPFRSK